jgi:hypothetical protein
MRNTYRPGRYNPPKPPPRPLLGWFQFSLGRIILVSALLPSLFYYGREICSEIYLPHLERLEQDATGLPVRWYSGSVPYAVPVGEGAIPDTWTTITKGKPAVDTYGAPYFWPAPRLDDQSGSP